jgi:hypothetical protein
MDANMSTLEAKIGLQEPKLLDIEDKPKAPTCAATVEKILSSLEAGEPLQETRKTLAQGVSVFTAEDGNALRHALAPSP